jgi:uncharacterized protein (DUF4415 family)
MNSKPNAELADDENPEWTAKDFANAKPASEMLSSIFSAATATELLRPRGRPRVATPRARMNMRIDSNVYEALRSSGRGWQTRVHGFLAEAVATGRL